MSLREDPNASLPRDLREQKTPKCVGLIMDGNRRWASRNGHPRTAGHQAGYEKLLGVIQWAKQERIGHLIAYAFSTENQQRSREEVDALMELFRSFFKQAVRRATANNVRFRVIGMRDTLPDDVRTGIDRLERETAHCTGLSVIFALTYGSRAEIIDTINRIKAAEPADREVTEHTVDEYLWTADLPDPDMIIRTGGRRRLSNFLLWQAAYSELFFTDTLWPDFTQKEFTKMLYEYTLRTKTKGK